MRNITTQNRYGSYLRRIFRTQLRSVSFSRMGVLLGACLVTFTMLSSAHAAAVYYSDRTSWTTAIGGAADWTVDFNSFAVDTEFRTAALDLGPFSLLGDTANTNADLVDVQPYEGSISATTHTTPAANIYTSTGNPAIGAAPETVTMTFDALTTAWGADFFEIGVFFSMLIEFADTSTEMKTIGTGADTLFLGLTSAIGISKITFYNSAIGTLNGSGGLVDDIQGVSADTSVVPLPAALPLFAGGLGAMGLLGWRRKRKKTAAITAEQRLDWRSHQL